MKKEENENTKFTFYWFLKLTFTHKKDLTYGGYVTGTIPLAFGGGLFIAAKRACISQYNLLFKL